MILMLALGLPITAIVRSRTASASTRSVIRLRIDAIPTRHTVAACIFAIRAPIAGGGTETTCLQSIDRPPAPNATMHSKGTMTFAWPAGVLKAHVRIIQRFAADGVHATQSTDGTITGGTGPYRNAHGSIRGRGSVIDRRDRLGRVQLDYTIRLT
jgi:hypothetical protein